MLEDTQSGFNPLLSSIFSRNLGSMPEIPVQILLASGKDLLIAVGAWW